MVELFIGIALFISTIILLMIIFAMSNFDDN